MPTSTYRLQLRAAFGFDAAAAVVPYLADLGVSHVYCSPVLASAPGSAHGYDVVDHSRLDDELGGADGWARLLDACRRHGLGLVVDVVPNHMTIPVPERLNAAFWDLLRHGQSSAYRDWFDVDWSQHDGRILLPVLGRPLDECLRAGEIEITAGEVRYYDHVFPLAPGTQRLEEQHYRLAHWRLAGTELNYRRFFDVTTLVGVRVEVPAVFDATHALVLELVRRGEVDGLRIDHPDGLADPGGYLHRLAEASGSTWTVVEKILESNETLPPSWRCAGTTGYDALTAVTQLLVDPAGERPLTDLYVDLTAQPGDAATVVAAAKHLVVRTLFQPEVDRLLRELRDDGLDASRLRPALEELLAQFDVYRSYAEDPDSMRHLDAAVDRAAADHPELREALEQLREPLRHCARFAQTTGPVMAKGVEDTAFYRYHRLTALNEVGGDPGTFGRDLAQWHGFCERIARNWPQTMTALTTHDTKRSEDVRARLLVLAEVPQDWAAAVRRWRAVAAQHRPVDANTDYLLWQTLVGAWPLPVERLQAYLEKATREAKQHTSWTDPDEEYDAQLRHYVDAVCGDEALMRDVESFVRDVVDRPGRSNSLSQKLLQLTMPGIPDVYQGQELPDFSLVDPDNRRPVDYDQRRRSLTTLVEPKQLVTATALRLRRERPEVFAAGYSPVSVDGPAGEHAVSFARGDAVVTVATRLPVGLTRAGGWGETALVLPAGSWHDLLTGTPVADPRLRTVLAELPVALLGRSA